jgi:intracellular sulfur oxidation DsrE/DsrF family protein
MNRSMTLCLALLLAVPAATPYHWPAPKSPLIPDATGYVRIPGAAVPLRPNRVYRAICDARAAGASAGELAPAIDMAASEVNLLRGEGVPPARIRFAIVFHGDAIDAILDDAHYRARHRAANPNLHVLHELRQAGVELYVCGQNLAADGIDPASLSPDVKVALDALIVLMTYQGDGYALMSF